MSFKIHNNGFLGDNNKPNVQKIYKNDEQNDLLTLQIKYALGKMTSENSVNIFCNLNNCSDYYLGNNNTFFNNLNNNKEKKNICSRNTNYYNKFSMKKDN